MCERNERRVFKHIKYSLIKADKANEDGNKIKCIAGDTQKFLNKGITHEMNQELLDMRIFYSGIVVKIWKGNGINESVYFKHNKLTTKESVLFYHKFWINRCKTSHDEEEQKKRLSQWCENSFNEIENG